MKGRRKEDVLAAVQEDTERMLSSPGGTAQWSHAAALADRLQMDRANVARELNLLYQNGQLIKIQGKRTHDGASVFFVIQGMVFEVLRVYGHSLFGTASGGNIFRCTTKDIEERRAKGVATPFNPLGLMRDSILTYFVPTFSQRCV